MEPGMGGTEGESVVPQAPARVYVQLSPTKYQAVMIRTGLSDGSFTEVLSNNLHPGQTVVTGALGGKPSSNSMTPPPGMGGPMMRGGGGGRGR